MKILRYLSVLAAAAGLLTACQEMEMVRTYAPEDVVAPSLRGIQQNGEPVDEIVVTSENMGTAVTFTWDAADFGVSTQIHYAIEAAYGSDTLAVMTGLSSTSAEMTYEAINTPLALAVEDGGLGLPSGTATEVYFMVSATIGDTFGTYYSEGIPVTVTVTQAERTYPMVYVIGDYSGWGWDTAQKLYSFSNDEVNYTGVIGFGGAASNGFKLTGGTNWDNGNWGTDGNAAAPEDEAASVTLINDGGSGNIKAYSKNFYRFSFNRSTLVLTNELSFDALYLVGSAEGLTWDSSKPENQMNFDTERQLFYIDYTLNEGDEIKLLTDNGTWFGGTADGGLNSQDNIKITASGNYRVYINLNNPDEMTWELNAADYGTGGDEPEPEPEPEPETTWRVHAQTVEFPEWGDVEMVSASSNIVAFKAEGVEVAANSQFGFLDPDDQWYAVDNSFAAGASPYDVTIGTAFTVSTTATNANIVEAGTYDYWILPDLGRGYVTEPGVKPEYVPETYGVCGTINGWGDIGDLAMTEEGGYYVRKGVSLTTSDQFKIRFNNEWNDEENYGGQVAGLIDINTGVTLVNGSGAQNMSVGIDGTYDIYFDKDNLLIYVMAEGTAPAE